MCSWVTSIAHRHIEIYLLQFSLFTQIKCLLFNSVFYQIKILYRTWFWRAELSSCIEMRNGQQMWVSHPTLEEVEIKFVQKQFFWFLGNNYCCNVIFIYFFIRYLNNYFWKKLWRNIILSWVDIVYTVSKIHFESHLYFWFPKDVKFGLIFWTVRPFLKTILELKFGC